MKPKVYLTRLLPPAVMARLEKETELTWHKEDTVASREAIIAGAKGRDALLCNILDKVDASLLEACPGLKIIANFGVGFNNIEVAAATARKIPVTNTPGVLTDATADMSFALMMAVGRRLCEGERVVRAKQWTGWNPMQLLGADVSGATLGLIGFGRIGKAMAKRARAFDMNLIYWNRTRLSAAEETETGAIYAPMDEVLRQADYISLHVAYTPDTHHLIGAKQFALMQPTAFVINTARGPVIDEAALVVALKSKRIAGAGLDVFEREPQIEAGLFDCENAVLAPHLGSATIATRTKMGMIAVENLLAVCAGLPPLNCVNPQIYS